MMRLLLMRHATAVRSGPYSDADRPLTAEGELQAERVARALVLLEQEPRFVLTSPAERCRRTAAPIAAAFGLTRDRIRVAEEAAVDAGAARLLGALASLGDCERVLVVAHQPDLEALTSVLLTGTVAVALHYRCSSIAALDVDALPPSRPAILAWFLDPSAVRWIAGAAGESD